MVKEDVIIIGAGLAGLTAARQIGSENVLLLEKNNYVGGRIKTIAISDAFVDVGSQFFCGTDENVWRLLRENNLEKAVLKLDFSNMAFFHNNRVEEINDDHLALIEDIVERFDHFDGDKKISFDEWFLSTYGERRKLYIPYSIIRAISFSRSRDISLSYAVYVIRSFFDECFTLERGLGELVKPLYRDLKIRTNVEVSSLSFRGDRLVGLKTKSGEYIDVEDKFVVLTTPPENIEVTHNLKVKEILSKIRFISCSLIAFKVRKIYEEKPYQIFMGDYKQKISVVEQIDLGGHYFIGCLIPHPRKEKPKKTYLINLCKNFLRRIFDKNFDKFIIHTVYEEWEDALPIVDHRYLETINSIKRIDVDNLLLAGDYTTPNPSMDSAIWSGLEAGEKVVEIGQ
ncbi:MAG: hypothetical protein DRO01_07770 [Thermoproteota archaeon]|nr:MAG: hypothetical protein DRO01_07770 [Candidatus Korarchaeota archaeon]